MAEATRPVRGARKAATPATTKPATTKAEGSAAVTPDTVLELVHDSDTKNFAKFVAPEGQGVKGSLYFPLGTENVRVAAYGVPQA